MNLTMFMSIAFKNHKKMTSEVSWTEVSWTDGLQLNCYNLNNKNNISKLL